LTTPTTHSYHQLIAAAGELSFQLAYADAQIRGTRDLTPLGLKEAVGRYFDRLIKLSAIDAQAMMPESEGEGLPAWIKLIFEA